MKDYSEILKEITSSIESEKSSIEFTTNTIVKLVDISIETYSQLKLLKDISNPQIINTMLISLENFAQSVIDTCNDSIQEQLMNSQSSNNNFVFVLTKVKDLHTNMLATLILLRSDITNIFNNSL
jgi:uncharacterized protein YutE (UPF0331/DUF86 family)